MNKMFLFALLALLLGLFYSSSSFSQQVEKDSLFINTEKFSEANYKVAYNEKTYDSLRSGSANSEVLIKFRKGSRKNVVYLTVLPDKGSIGLNLRIIKISDDCFVEVKELDKWVLFSSDYYHFFANKISFFNHSKKTLNYKPFRINLINGVLYDKKEGLVFTVSRGIQIDNSTLSIIKPNNELLKIKPDVVSNRFLWDGNNAVSGVYSFVVELKGKRFNGQFIVK